MSQRPRPSAPLVVEPPEPSERTPLDPTSQDAFDRVIRGRRSVRRFRDEPIEDVIVQRVLEAGLWAPSPHGTQPWRFAVITQRANRERLADAMAGSWRDNLEMDNEPAEVIEGRLAGSRRRLLEAPVLVVISLYTSDSDRYPDPTRAEAERTMAIQSLGACVENMLLAAFASGIDAGWMCAPLFCPEIVAETLDLDRTLTPHGLIAMGHAAADPKRRSRRSLDTLIVWDDRK
ncbi:MAG TPA: nitroreductase family protein [Thermomicrobiales bacterium]|nr:nitroreductase family protein [Thermomicrobiales bacterium]